jgi:PAS domain S-box-containing protein
MHVLDSEPEKRFDRISRITQRLLGVETVVLSLVDADRQWFKSRINQPLQQTPRDISFCGHAILDDEILHIPDATADERFHDNPLVTSPGGVRLYAGAPIHSTAGRRLGAFCAIDSRPRALSEDDLACLRDLADLVERELQDRAAALWLAERRGSVGRPEGLLSDSRERVAEASLRRFFELSAELFCIADFAGNLLDVNRAWSDVTGLAPAAILALPFAALFHPDDVPEIQAAAGRAAAGQSLVGFRCRLRGGDDAWHWLDWTVTADRGHGQLYVAGRDVTLEVEVQAHLESLHEELRARNRELDQFAYVVSHDLKAPLRAIASLSRFIEEDAGERLDDVTRGHLDKMRDRVARLEAMIDGILRYTKAGRERGSERIDVAQAARNVVDLLSPRPGIRVDLAPDLPHVVGHALQFEQVLANLIGNAIKYHDRDEGRIELLVADAGRHWRFVVRDDGPGIDPSYHERIFSMFQTLQARDSYESTGIGLTIVQKIIKAHGGEIGVESDGKRGTTFWFTWPKAPV